MAFWIDCEPSSALTLLSAMIVMTAEKVAPFSKTMVHLAPRQKSFCAGRETLQTRVIGDGAEVGDARQPGVRPLVADVGQAGLAGGAVDGGAGEAREDGEQERAREANGTIS